MTRRQPALPSIAVAVVGALFATLLTMGGAPANAAAPSTPRGLTPDFGQTVSGTPRLSWDPVGVATKYNVQVATSSEFVKPVWDRTTVNTRSVPTVKLPAGDLWWRVRAVSGSEAGDWAVGTFNVAAIPAPTQQNPADGAALGQPEEVLSFTWSPTELATGYEVAISTDPEFVDPALIKSYSAAGTTLQLAAPPAAGTYYWRVRAKLASNYTSEWSSVWSYTIESLAPPSLQGPSDSFSPPVRDVDLNWNPVPGAASYELQIGTDINFTTTTHVKSGIVGTRYSPPTTLRSDQYYWRIRGVDSSGNKPDWSTSPIWKFDLKWPDQPQPIYPVGGSTITSPLYYQWTPLDRASSYRLQLSPDQSFQTQLTTCSTVHTTFVPGGCLPSKAGIYFWRVIGVDNASGQGTDAIVASRSSFVYSPPVAPTTPAPTEQVNGYTAALSGTSTTGAAGRSMDVCHASLPAKCENLRQNPLLSWSSVPNASSYKVYLARDQEMTNMLSGYPVTTPSTMWMLNGNLPDSQAGSAYFWHVVACNKAGCVAPQHAQHAFNKLTVAPIPVGPTSGTVVSDDVRLEWGTWLAAEADAARLPKSVTNPSLTASNATDAARTYTVQTSVVQDFTSTIESIDVDQTWLTSFATTYPEGPIFWRVRANDDGSVPSVWSASQMFVKRSPVPDPVFPADQQESRGDQAFTWQALNFAASYDIEIYKNADSQANIGNRVVAANTKQPSHALTAPLPVSPTAYTWRIRRVDAKGRKGDWSCLTRDTAGTCTGLHSFTVTGPAPTEVSPEPNAEVPARTALFVWDAEPRAKSYRWEQRDAASGKVTAVTTLATSWAPEGIIATGRWEWRVVAVDSANHDLGASPWRGFTISDQALKPTTQPRISGSAVVGRDLTVSPGTWPGQPRFQYQWYRAQKAISGATGLTYRVVGADAGSSLAVLVTATASVPGYAPGLAAAGPARVAKVSSYTTAVPTKATIRARQYGKVAVHVSATGIADPLGKVQVLDGSRVVATGKLKSGRSGSTTVRLPFLKKGTHRIRVRYAGSSSTTASTSSTRTLTVKR